MDVTKKHKVDIIIPIYNALDSLKSCLESLIKYSDLQYHQLILVNDASPDFNVLPYIKSFRREHTDKNIAIIHHENNMGFSGSINDGITHSNNDVLLLNSDTIVTKHWLEKIIECAYSSESIATVTPLSNNATLCSVPNFCQENSLPIGYSIDSYADLIEQISLQLYPRIPVANGFCMFIKRAVINVLGVFDNKTFERGYGEENDFCYRAEQAGYHHVMCDNTFVFHKGTDSFISDEKKAYIKKHEKILEERYPIQNRTVALHCRDNPNKDIQENIKLWTELRNSKKSILYLVQSDFRKDSNDHLGGTQLHVKDLVSQFREDYNVFVAARNLEYLNLTAYINSKEFYFKFYIGKVNTFQEFRSSRIADIYKNILKVFQINLIHIHHTKDLTLELYYEAKKKNIPVLTTLHDYYTICPTIKMVDYTEELCIDKAHINCHKCLEKKLSISPNLNYINIWREYQKECLLYSKAIIVPSQSAEQIIHKYYPELQNKTYVIEHGNEIMIKTPSLINKSKKFHIAFIGGVSLEKGSKISYELIKRAPKDIEWFFFGMWGYNDLSMLNQKNYTKTGLYEREDLPKLIEKYEIDLICLLPIWPETYCYTLSEALMCGVPVIASNIGALGERVQKERCGWLVDVNNAVDEALQIISRIKTYNKEYLDTIDNIRKIKIRTLSEMKEDYNLLYHDLLVDRKPENISIAQYTWCLNAFLFGKGEISSSYNPILLKEQITETEEELKRIKNSFGYKGFNVLTQLNIPYKKQVKKGLYTIYKLLRKR